MAKILIVEDNDTLRRLIAQRLERRGHAVILAQDGETGVASARAAHPDLILLDVSLAALDGIGVAHAMKADDHTRAIPMIAFTDGADDEVDRLKQVGLDELHVKPIDFGRLMQQIAKLLGEREPEGEPAAANS